jgi:glutamine---fructose-6-phosphate transaminase (isomerizing)
MQQGIEQQPGALRELIAAHSRGLLFGEDEALPSGAPVLTGMGASLHAAQIAAAHMQRLGLAACAVEASDLLYCGQGLLSGARPLVFVSQSGKSAEVAPILADMPPECPLIGVTNEAESPLALRSTRAILIHAGAERGVATRTYVNTLVALWLLARRWAGVAQEHDAAALAEVADLCDQILADRVAIVAQWREALGTADTLVFLGHGPHTHTARQSALMLAERARVPALAMGIGAFRHGPIEIAQSGVGVVVFAPPGRTHESAVALAEELRGYSARVLVIENGRAREGAAPPGQPPVDEFLTPILDVIPAQLFADDLARSRGIAPEFRYLSAGVRRV